MTMLTDQHVETDLTELYAFIDRVFSDGRYLDTFQTTPDQVAQTLGMVISPNTCEAVASRPLEELTYGLYSAKFRRLIAPPSRTVRPQAGPAMVGGIVSIVIVAGVVITWTIVRQRAKGILDTSPDRDAKL